MQCPYCEAEISDNSLKCKQCGEWVKTPEGGDDIRPVSCPYCEGKTSPTALKCRHCGEWLQENKKPLPKGQAPFPSQPVPGGGKKERVIVKDKSPLFAVITLLCYIFVYPVGLLLNAIGLFTGPRRGCFLVLLIIFLLIPGALVLAVIFGGFHIGIPLIEEWILRLRHFIPL